ncbi:diguanylate cyclase domain-containing protein [Zavarzinia sp. CC-PAN008]|uniref:GGDEF domain-containing protein n=1 Tax=Zavarzinia sp. CC-PAN008 TaxID=3243332 RepID=UPI003F744BB0
MPGDRHPDRTALEAALAQPAWRLRFPATLEQVFEADMGPARCRELRAWILAGMAIHNLLLVPQWLLMPDIFPAALLAHFLVVTPVMLLLTLPLMGTPGVLAREGAVALAVIVGTLAPLGWTLVSTSPDRGAMADAIAIAFLYLALMQRLRFPILAVACVVVLAIYVAAILALPDPLFSVSVSRIFFHVTGLALALFGAYALEREMRRTYLLDRINRQQTADLDRLSRCDPLTGLGNRRAMTDALAEANRDTAAAGPISAIMLDIDHFKKLNDAAGHLQGDQCLVRIAGLVQAQLRGPGDQAFRFGGEEFLILLRATPLAVAQAVADRLRRAIEADAVPHPGLGPRGVVTASLGVGTVDLGPSFRSEDLIAAADDALYGAKHAGRNMVWPLAA